MNLARILSLCICAIALGGCVTAQRANMLQDDVAWTRQVTTQRDEYRKSTVIQGADLQNADATVFLRSTKLDVAPMADLIVIYVMARMNEWKFLDAAYASDGSKLSISVLDRDVRYCSRYGCALAEHVVIHTSRQYLITKLDLGLDIRLDGRRGKHYVYLPPQYIAAFLASLPAPAAKVPPS